MSTRVTYDIIMLAIARWDGPYSSTAYSLAKEFAKNHRVFYIDNPFTYKEFWTGRNSKEILARKAALLKGENKYKQIEGLPPKFVAVTPPAVLPINWMPAGPAYDKLMVSNNKKLINTIRGIIADHNVQNYIFINNWNPFYGHDIPADIQPDLFVYQSVDDMSQAPYVAKHGPRLEKEMIRKADFVTCTSKELVRIQQGLDTPVHYLPNAADISLFKTAAETNLPRPKELEGLEGKKIIGYTGAISIRIDYELLKKVAETHKDKVLLMVGPKGEQFEDVGLEAMDNVIFTGRKDISELPAYLQYIDCTIIPFRCTQLTRSIYPLKINEYLAAGKAVVSTHFSDDIGDFSHIAYIATEHDDFVDAIHHAIITDSDEKRENRIAIAETNTWEARVNVFWELVQNWEESKLKHV